MDYDPTPFVRANPCWRLFDICGWFLIYAVAYYATAKTMLLKLSWCRIGWPIFTNLFIHESYQSGHLTWSPRYINLVMTTQCIDPQMPPNISDYENRPGLFITEAYNGLGGWIEGTEFTAVGTADSTRPAIQLFTKISALKISDVFSPKTPTLILKKCRLF